MSGPKLFEAGYPDLVLIRHKDKAPAKTGWLHDRPTREQVAAWTGNIGVIAAEFPAVDIDLFDDDLANEVVALTLATLGGAPMRRSHRAASRLLPYRTDTPFPKKVLTLPEGRGKVEILGSGRQYVVHGLHPEGTPYSWERAALWEIPSTKLSLITETRVEAFLNSLQSRFGGLISGGRGKERAPDVDRADLIAPSLQHVAEALAAVPNTDAFLARAFEGQTGRDAWVQMAHAVYGAGGPLAEAVFLEWTATYTEGVVELDRARHTYQSCADTYTGWPTLDRIVRDLCVPDATDEFEPDLGPAPVQPHEYPPSVRLTDEYILDRLLPDLEDEVAYVSGAWYIWRNGSWVRDEGLTYEMRVRSRLRATAIEIDNRAACAPNEKEGRALRGLAKRLQGRAGIEAIVGLSRGPLSRAMEDFDRDPLALNTPSGLVDLTTGDSRPTRPQDLVSRVSTVAPSPAYDQRAAPHWASFLDHLTRGDTELENFLQRYMGYCLTGVMTEKKLVFVWGSNSNTGKSTFVNAVSYAMGNYVRAVDVDAFMGNRSNTDSLAQLPGVRLAAATEASAGQKWDDKIIKAITGGDPIEARRLYQSFFSFRPQFKMLIAGNHKPSLASVDQAMLKRVLIVPMNHKVEDPDFGLGRKLEAEAPHILRWMIEGCLAWQREGLNPPEAVMAATEEYADEENTLAQWLEECCEYGDDFRATTNDLYTSWNQWCRQRGSDKAQSAVPFARDLNAIAEEGHPIERYRTSSARGFKGIHIKPRVALGTEEFDT